MTTLGYACAITTDDRFVLGTGEALNEHITGQRWPSAAIRRGMPDEAVAVIRELFTGTQVNHHGCYYTVENARLYTLPSTPTPIYVSGYGPHSARLAGRIGGGFQRSMPDAALVAEFQHAGGLGKPTQAGFKVCYAAWKRAGVRTAHRLWPSEQLPGEVGQNLPTPVHFEQELSLVTEQMVEQSVSTGPDAKPYLDRIRQFADAGFDKVYVQQIGPGPALAHHRGRDGAPPADCLFGCHRRAIDAGRGVSAGRAQRHDKGEPRRGVTALFDNDREGNPVPYRREHAVPKTADFILDLLRQWGCTGSSGIPVMAFCPCWARWTGPPGATRN